MTTAKQKDVVNVDFKLSPERAATAIGRFDWLSPHAFRTLSPAGWVTARLSDRRRVRALERLLKESRALHGEVETHEPPLRQGVRVRHRGCTPNGRAPRNGDMTHR